MKCTACGENNVDNARFCAFCGAKLDTTRHLPVVEPAQEEKPEPAPDAARTTAQPLGDNPIQPARRSMPHLYGERPTATADYTVLRPREPVQLQSPVSDPVLGDELAAALVVVMGEGAHARPLTAHARAVTVNGGAGCRERHSSRNRLRSSGARPRLTAPGSIFSGAPSSVCRKAAFIAGCAASARTTA